MKNIHRIFGAMRSIAIIALVAVIGFSMAACDSGGNGGDNGSIPAIPGGLTATAVSSSEINLAWNGVSGATGYYVYRSENSAGPFTEIGTATLPSYSNTGLTANTTYYYRVAAYNSAGSSGQSAVAQATTQSGAATPITLTPASVTIDDDNLTATVTVGGTATGTITLDTDALPSGVTATVNGATITVTGVRPATYVPIKGSYTVVVTRDSETLNLPVVVNLTTTWTLDPSLAAGLYVGAPDSLTESSTPIGTVAANDVAAAVTYINNNNGEYTLLLSEDVTVSTGQSISLPSGIYGEVTQLTIIGIESERKISLAAAVYMFEVDSDVTLTLGANITLVGHNATENAVVVIYGTLIMLDGSKITGNNSSYNPDNWQYGMGAAVLNFGIFTMKGGTITGNSATDTTFMVSGGLYSHQATVILEGGSIEGNTGTAGDVYFFGNPNNDLHTLSQTAKIGTLTLVASDFVRTSLTISAGWTGTIAGLNLYAMYYNTLSSAINRWANYRILGDGVNATTVGQITLGNFIDSTLATQSISDTHKIEEDGWLRYKQ